MSLKNLAKQVKKDTREMNTTVEECFLQALDTHIVNESTARNDGREHKLAFYPSSYFKCPRQVYYGLIGLPKVNKYNARSERILAVGTALHQWVQEGIFQEMSTKKGALIKLVPHKELSFYGNERVELVKEHKSADMEVKYRDYRFTKDIPISAMVDGVVEFMGKVFVLEFKTINPTDFDLLIEPLKDHIKQGALYSLSFKLPVMFLYLCKGTQKWKAYFQRYSEDQIEWTKSRLNLLEDCYLAKELPDKDGDTSHCKWCPYGAACAENRQ